MEVVLALFIFLMMTMMFAAVIPTAARSARYANSYGVAAAICQRKLDQLAEAGFGKITPTDLHALGIVDKTAPTTDGTATVYTFTDNTSANNPNNPDNLDGYFPGGTNPATRATGTLCVDQWTQGQGYQYVSNSPIVVLYKVTVTVSWRDAAGVPQSLSMNSLISRVTLS
jgi:hypothetical protein